MDAVTPAQARALIEWWIAAGVDAPVGDAAASWLALRSSARPADRAAEPPGLRPERPVEPVAGVESREASLSASAATIAARAATTPLALQQAARAVAGPGALLFDGATDAPIVFVTDAPTFEDERAGGLLGGDAGRLLDRMLAAIALDRGHALLAATVPRPGGEQGEIGFLHRLIALVQPRVLVTLGSVATVRLTGATRGLNRLRGQWLPTTIDGVDYPVLPTFHPAHLLANPAHKALAWADLRAVRSRLDAL